MGMLKQVLVTRAQFAGALAVIVMFLALAIGALLGGVQ